MTYFSYVHAASVLGAYQDKSEDKINSLPDPNTRPLFRAHARTRALSQGVLSQIPNGMTLLKSMVRMDPFEDSSVPGDVECAASRDGGREVGRERVEDRSGGRLTVRNVLSLLA